MRRRFNRGLHYLTYGVDFLDGQRQSFGSPFIIDTQLKQAAETFSTPLLSRLIYILLRVALLEDERLLDDFMVKEVSPGIWNIASLFWTEENAVIAKLAMA